VPTDLDQSLYHQVYGMITIPALRLVENHRTKVISGPLKPCSGSFTTIYGLPCRHKCMERIQSRTGLTIDDFHSHWHWNWLIQPNIQEPGPEFVLEPLKVAS